MTIHGKRNKLEKKICLRQSQRYSHHHLDGCIHFPYIYVQILSFAFCCCQPLRNTYHVPCAWCMSTPQHPAYDAQCLHPFIMHQHRRCVYREMCFQLYLRKIHSNATDCEIFRNNFRVALCIVLML